MVTLTAGWWCFSEEFRSRFFEVDSVNIIDNVRAPWFCVCLMEAKDLVERVNSNITVQEKEILSFRKDDWIASMQRCRSMFMLD